MPIIWCNILIYCSFFSRKCIFFPWILWILWGSQKKLAFSQITNTKHKKIVQRNHHTDMSKCIYSTSSRTVSQLFSIFLIMLLFIPRDEGVLRVRRVDFDRLWTAQENIFQCISNPEFLSFNAGVSSLFPQRTSRGGRSTSRKGKGGDGGALGSGFLTFGLEASASEKPTTGLS